MRKVLIGLMLVLAAALSAQADPDAVAEFYRGKVVTLYVGYGPGGGFDVMGRLLARHMGKYVPGHPEFVAQNMPGAGSLVLANYIYNRAPADGTQFGIIARNLPLIALVGGDPNVRFDPRKFTWIGSSSDFSDDAYPLMVRKDSPVKTFADLRRADGPPLVIGGTAEGSSSADVPKILQDALGIRLKLILGYPQLGGFVSRHGQRRDCRAHGRTVVGARHPPAMARARQRLPDIVDVRAEKTRSAISQCADSARAGAERRIARTH